MRRAQSRPNRRSRLLPAACCLVLLSAALAAPPTKPPPASPAANDTFTKELRPTLARYCLECHSSKKKKGDLDLERFVSLETVHKDPRPWQAVLDMLENGEMPPKKSPQLASEDKHKLIAQVKGLLDAEAKARAGDPGRVVMRRLSNAEYDNTVRDLTGVDLRPAREFPVDGSAGEGFTNAGDALVMSPTLLNKYLSAAKEIAAHSVMLPDGFRFSPSVTRRDWTDEILADLNKFYGQFTADGKLPLARYLTATLRYREGIRSGELSVDAVANREGLSPKYLRILWAALNDSDDSYPLGHIRSLWRQATPETVGTVVAEISACQAPLWKTNIIGSYRDNKSLRNEPVDPPIVTSQTLKLKPKLAPGQTEVVLYLQTRSLSPSSASVNALWHRPRFEGSGEPLLLRDIDKYAERFTVDYRAMFADTEKYLAATASAANDPEVKVDDLAAKNGIDAELLRRWMAYLAVEPLTPRAADAVSPRAAMPAVPLQLLTRKLEVQPPAVRGWGTYEPDTLPILVANNSEQSENIPGTVPPHKVAVHPTPTRFIAAAWTSPIEGVVQIDASIAHAHPACGNGVAWWLEYRRTDKSAVLEGGVLNLGQRATMRPHKVKVAKGDEIVLAVGARDRDHSCDLTTIDLSIRETSTTGRVWDLARDVAGSVVQANPHADSLGNPGVWRFGHGSDPTTNGKLTLSFGTTVPVDSAADRWRRAAADPARQKELASLATKVKEVLTGSRPAKEKSPDRILYDTLVSLDGPLFAGSDWQAGNRTRSERNSKFGLVSANVRRSPPDEASLIVPADGVVQVRLPAGLFRDREFIVEGRPDPASPRSIVQFQVSTTPTATTAPAGTACVAADIDSASKQLRSGLDKFREVFPSLICYRRIIPDDEIICLKLYHREDENLGRLFLDATQQKQLDRLWGELRHVSRWPVTESRNLPTFIGFVTQDGEPKKTAFYEGLKEPFRKRAEEFEGEADAAALQQLEKLVEFAARAYRRPLRDSEKNELFALYKDLRVKNIPHEEAFRTVLTRVLISPSFLFRIELAPSGLEPGLVSDWELATRLSYFMWATTPDAELLQLAATNKLHQPAILTEQVNRMLRDPRVRGLGSEFGTQWAHVRDIRRNREKNERLFPTFDDSLRDALSEEAVRFFQHLFQADRPLHDVVDANWTFLNDALARHYGIPGVSGAQWRLVDGVNKYGRGGILTLGSVHTTQSGASRTSPVLRGNWLVEVLLGEKLPKPPPNVPLLPEDESSGETLTVRQLVEKHTRIAECAVCHRRIDPFGFALERYDPIGRYRDKDLGGRPIDAHARLKDGTEFEGVDGLRHYLLTQRRDEFQRHFCRKLLGYALGRSVVLSDQSLVDEMLDELNKNDYRLSVAVQTIVHSKQFRSHRGLEATRDEQ